MSTVSNVVLVCSLTDGEDFIVPISTWLADNSFPPLSDLGRHAGGNKVLECCLFASAFNYFSEDAFAQFIASLPWGDLENVVLTIQPDEGPTRVWSFGALMMPLQREEAKLS